MRAGGMLDTSNDVVVEYLYAKSKKCTLIFKDVMASQTVVSC